MKITMAHGSGGKSTTELIENIFAKHFSNDVLNQMEDCAVVEGSKRIAMTTDSYVVNPVFFKGGDIGHLAICGTVNDLSMGGAVPKYITCGFIIEEGADFSDLEKIAKSMADTAKAAGVLIVAGDTKVIEGTGGIYINTAGVGFVPEDLNLSSKKCEEGDLVIVSGDLGDHHATILSSRLEIENSIESDCAPLNGLVKKLMDAKLEIKCMRDITRGGLGTILNEFAKASHCTIELIADSLPVSSQVASFCKMLGLDPLYMGNEGKMVLVVSKKDSEEALRILKEDSLAEEAAIVGSISKEEDGLVYMKTSIGGKRKIDVLFGEGLPRIC